MVFLVLGAGEVKELLAVIGRSLCCWLYCGSHLWLLFPRPHDNAYHDRYFMAMGGMVEQSLWGKVLKESLAMLDSIDVSSGHESTMHGVEDGK